MTTLGKLKKLKEDLESKLGFFEYKANRFSELIKKELENKLKNKISNFIEVVIKPDSSMDYSPIIRINFDENHIKINSEFTIMDCDNSVYNSSDILDKAIAVGFLATEIKLVGKTYDKINKYLKILKDISKECVGLSEDIREQRGILHKEQMERKFLVLEEFISEGKEFILDTHTEIFDKRFRSRELNEYNDGVLLTILKKEKRSYHVNVNGKRLISEYTFGYTRDTKFKVGLPRLIETIRDSIKEGSNPEFERALKLAELMD